MIDEVRTILVEGGAVEPIRIEPDANGWLVSAFFGPVQHLGHTGIDKNTSNDPRDMARRLVAIANTAAAAPEPDQVAEITPITDIREAYEDSHADDESPAEVGASEPADDDAGDVGVDGGDSSGDYLAEETADSPPDDPDPSDVVDEPDPAQLGGVLIQEGTEGETVYSGMGSDPLAAAKAMKAYRVLGKKNEMRTEFNSEIRDFGGGIELQTDLQYLTYLNSRMLAYKENAGPALSDDENFWLADLQGRDRLIDSNADRLSDLIYNAPGFVDLDAVDVRDGWPE